MTSVSKDSSLTTGTKVAVTVAGLLVDAAIITCFLLAMEGGHERLDSLGLGLLTINGLMGVASMFCVVIAIFCVVLVPDEMAEKNFKNEGTGWGSWAVLIVNRLFDAAVIVTALLAGHVIVGSLYGSVLLFLYGTGWVLKFLVREKAKAKKKADEEIPEHLRPLADLLNEATNPKGPRLAIHREVNPDLGHD